MSFFVVKVGANQGEERHTNTMSFRESKGNKSKGRFQSLEPRPERASELVVAFFPFDFLFGLSENFSTTHLNQLSRPS